MSRTWDRSLRLTRAIATYQSAEYLNPLRADYKTVGMRSGGIFQWLDRVRESECSRRAPMASLGEALARVPTEMDLASSADFHVVVSGRQRELNARLRQEVYSIAREALVNAFRHSGAREITAEVEYGPTRLRISVRDNGCGIDTKDLELRRDEISGLQGMRQRAEEMGARLRLLSRITLGTEVELSVPCSHQSMSSERHPRGQGAKLKSLSPC